MAGTLGAVVGAASWALLVPSLGATGAALGLLAAASVGAALYAVLGVRWLGFPLRASARPALGLLGACALGLLGPALPLGAWLALPALAAWCWLAFGAEARLALALGRSAARGAPRGPAGRS